MKKKTGTGLRIAAFALLALLPFGLITVIGESCENPYNGAFTAALEDKYERLSSGEGGRLILIGGSSLPFGVRSDVLEEQLGMPVVNLGTYAALGTKAMCEIALACVKPGDVLILAPELSPQTYSLYFNAEYMWEAVSEKREIIGTFSRDERRSMRAAYLPFLIGKIKNSGSGSSFDGSVYARSSFNEYGDIFIDRPVNVMAGGADASSPVSLDGLDGETFTAYVNEWYESVRSSAAEAYFTFCPVNAGAAEYTGAESDAFADKLQEKLHCRVIGSPAEMTYDSKYFFNTNFHLNSAGSLLHTKTLTVLLRDALGIGGRTDIEVPEPGETQGNPGLPDSDENEKYFTFVKVGSACYLESVKEEYRASVTSLRLPSVHEGCAVTGISSGTFRGCESLENLTVPDGYCIFDTGIFEGCGKLKRIYIEIKDPGRTSVPQKGFLDGVHPSAKLYIRGESWQRFVSDYSWRLYREYFEKS